MHRGAMHKAEKKIERLLWKIATIYVNARYPEGRQKGQPVYLSMFIMNDDDGIAVQANNRYWKGSDDEGYGIDMFGHVPVEVMEGGK